MSHAYHHIKTGEYGSKSRIIFSQTDLHMTYNHQILTGQLDHGTGQVECHINKPDRTGGFES